MDDQAGEDSFSLLPLFDGKQKNQRSTLTKLVILSMDLLLFVKTIGNFVCQRVVAVGQHPISFLAFK